MNRFILLLLPVIILIVALPGAAASQSLSDRVVLNNPATQDLRSNVHSGAGQMTFARLLGSEGGVEGMSTKFLYLDAGLIYPGGGIGHHFHHNTEEMFVILNGAAEFTISGRTSLVEGPVGVPNTLGKSHGLYNPTGDTLKWLNVAVGLRKEFDGFNLADDRVGVVLDPVPVFVAGRMQQERLRSNNNLYMGDGILYNRVIGPAVFGTNWNHLDHVVITAGKSAKRQLQQLEEVYYVMNGSGTITIGEETATIETDNAFFGALGETITISSDNEDDLELMVIGISDDQR